MGSCPDFTLPRGPPHSDGSHPHPKPPSASGRSPLTSGLGGAGIGLLQAFWGGLLVSLAVTSSRPYKEKDSLGANAQDSATGHGKGYCPPWGQGTRIVSLRFLPGAPHLHERGLPPHPGHSLQEGREAFHTAPTTTLPLFCLVSWESILLNFSLHPHLAPGLPHLLLQAASPWQLQGPARGTVYPSCSLAHLLWLPSPTKQAHSLWACTAWPPQPHRLDFSAHAFAPTGVPPRTACPLP